MDTRLIKQLAIAAQLGEMFEESCKYSHTVMARWNTPIEPDAYDVIEFRELLCRLAELHRTNRLLLTDVDYVISWVRKVGYEHNHIKDTWSTGVYGVRLHELQNIKQILSIPEFDLLKMDDTLEMHGYTYQIKEYRVYSTFLSVKLHDIANIQYDFSIALNWNDLEKIRLGDNQS